MKQQLFIGVAAALALSSPVFAQPAGGAAPTGAATGGAPSTTTGVIGITPPGVAGGVTPYRPAGAPAANTSAGGLPAPGSPPPSPAGASGSYVTNSINTTLQAGQVPSVGPTPGGDSATVGAASAGGAGLRTPNPSTGVYNGAPAQSYGAPGATPYTGPGAAAVPPGAAPYSGPGAAPTGR